MRETIKKITSWLLSINLYLFVIYLFIIIIIYLLYLFIINVVFNLPDHL